MWYALAAFAAAAALIILMPVRVIVSFCSTKQGTSSELDIKIGFLRFKIYPEQKKKSKPEPNNKEQKTEKKEKNSVLARIKAVIGIYSEFSEDFGSLLDYISRHAASFERLKLRLRYSTGDAAATGILCGVINGVIYSILGIIHHRARLKYTDISVAPDFGDSMLEIDSGCIVRLKNVHIIVIAVKLFKLYTKISRRRRQT